MARLEATEVVSADFSDPSGEKATKRLSSDQCRPGATRFHTVCNKSAQQFSGSKSGDFERYAERPLAIRGYAASGDSVRFLDIG